MTSTMDPTNTPSEGSAGIISSGPLSLEEAYPTKNNPTRFAMVLDNVYSPAECQELIALAEAHGYEAALVNQGGGRQSYIPDYRNSDRCIIDDKDVALDLMKRIRPFLPSHKSYLNHRKQTLVFPLTGLNERLRFLKYGKGGYFKPHEDGTFCRPDGSEMSWMTVMVYLNHGDGVDCEGGETCLLHPTEMEGWLWNSSPKVVHKIVPKPGRVLVFDHDIFHAGQEVSGGTKLCIRTDAMYSNNQDVNLKL